MATPSPITARERLVRWQPRFVLCVVCRSPARGFGWQEPQRVITPRPTVWFCSIICQAFFWQRARRSNDMVDLTDEEKAAICKAVSTVGETMQEIGWNTRFDALSEQQVLTLIEVAVGAFQEAMRDIAAANKKTSEVPY